MTPAKPLLKLLEQALAFAHAALDQPSTDRISVARTHAEAVLPKLRRPSRIRATLGEARQIVLLVTQLKHVLSAIDRTPAFA